MLSAVTLAVSLRLTVEVCEGVSDVVAVADIVIDGVVTGRDNITVASHNYTDHLGNTVVRTQGNMGWKFAHYQWVATTTGTVDIGFAMQSGFTNGIALDNISMHAMVPEPGSFVLAGLGLLPLGYMIRRRKNDAE